MLRRTRLLLAMSAAPAVLLFTLFCLPGCGRPKVQSLGPAVRLQPGQRFRFADVVTSKDTPGLERGTDGLLRLPRWGSSQPVVLASGAQVLSQRFVASGPFAFEAGLGVLPAGKESPEGARFIVSTIAQGSRREVLRREVRGASKAEDAAWTPAQLAISAKPGDEVEIQLSVEPFGRSPGALVWVNPTVSAPATTPPPNVVLIVVDDLRADHLGCYGSTRGASPWIDHLASQGTLFEEASSNATWTLSSVLSLLTSSYPLIRGYSQDLFQHQGQGIVSVARIAMPISLQGELRKRGYLTLGAVGGGFIDASFGFSSGYDWYWSPPTDRPTLFSDQLAVLKQRLSTAPTGPFFLLLHTHQTHNYLQGAGNRLSQFSAGYTGRLTDKKVLFDTVTGGSSRGLSPADLQYLRDLYDGELRETDQLLGDFTDWLRSRPWGKDTIVALSADHGEAFGEHGLLNHGFAPYRELSHVPLIVSYPKVAGAGKRVSDEVGLIDVMPTLLELSGGKVPEGVVGESLLPQLRGMPVDYVRPLLSEGRRPAMRVRLGSVDYLTWLGEDREELYDITTDPGETRNLAATQPAVLNRMRQAFAQEITRAGRGFRLVAYGNRPRQIAITLRCEAGFGYLLYPTSRRAGELWGNNPEAMAMLGKPYVGGREKQLTVTLPADDSEQVVLFDSADGKQPIRVEVSVGGRPVPPDRIFLGAAGEHPAPGAMELRSGAWVRPLEVSRVTAGPPRPAAAKDWGLQIWSLADRAGAASVSGSSAQGIPEDVQRQLHGLGYVK